MVETGRARSHPCHRPGATSACPPDKQTAYEDQAAETAERLKAGDLVWTTGRVRSSQQRVAFGKELKSRDTVAWRVRVWDANQATPKAATRPRAAWRGVRGPGPGTASH